MNKSPRFALLLMKDGVPLGIHELCSKTSSIGRGIDNDLVLEYAGISSRHARVSPGEQGWILEDLGSTNGTYVNDVRIELPIQLSAGDRICLGRYLTLLFGEMDSLSSGQADSAVSSGRPLAETAIDDPGPVPANVAPPRVLIQEAGGESQSHELTRDHYSIGRSDANDIQIDSSVVSRCQAHLNRTPGGFELVPLDNATNQFDLRGKPLQGPRILRDGDVLRIGGNDPGMMVTFAYADPSSAGDIEVTVEFGDRSVLSVGRDPSNDVKLDALQVSRHHARIEKLGGRIRVHDLRSANGTFVDGNRIEKEAWLGAESEFRIGPYRFVLRDGQLAQIDETSRGRRLEAVALNKWVREDLNLLENISLAINPKELVVVVGQSGGGKSTLVDAISGQRPPTSGRVFVDGIDLYRNFDAFRSNIGCVPQRDIIHMELTVRQALEYAAKLRMLPDSSPAERSSRVEEVLGELDLSGVCQVQVSNLSGGQQKRVSIGVELLTKPGLFFLDEPTSGLDPSTATALMHLLRRLADQGRTVVLITHATKDVLLADKVIFLVRGGYLAWFGPPEEALVYFDQFRTEADRRASEPNFDQIYRILEDPQWGSPQQWQLRFKEHSAFAEYIRDPLLKARDAGRVRDASKAGIRIPSRRQISAGRQFLVLTSRNLRILARDKLGLLLMLATAPIIASLDIIVSALIGRRVFDYTDGAPALVITTLFMMAIYAVMVGSLSQMREIVKERDIYRRERLVSLKIAPYVASKVSVAFLLAMYQGACYVAVRYVAFAMPGGARELLFIYVTMVLAALTGMIMGLFASALAPNANTAPLLIIVMLLPQIILGGAIIPLPGARQIVSMPTTTRWTYEALLDITRFGSDISGDACWNLPAGDRSELTESQKEFLGCPCMGPSILDRDSCDFPGLGSFHQNTVDQPRPDQPTLGVEAPPELELPSPPGKPADLADDQAVVAYFQKLETYQGDLVRYEETFRQQMEAYRVSSDNYQHQMQDYSARVSSWESTRREAMGRAEGLISGIYDDFGWGFASSTDQVPNNWLIMTRWIAQAAIGLVALCGILIVQKLRDGA